MPVVPFRGSPLYFQYFDLSPLCPLPPSLSLFFFNRKQTATIESRARARAISDRERERFQMNRNEFLLYGFIDYCGPYIYKCMIAATAAAYDHNLINLFCESAAWHAHEDVINSYGRFRPRLRVVVVCQGSFGCFLFHCAGSTVFQWRWFMKLIWLACIGSCQWRCCLHAARLKVFDKQKAFFGN